MLFASPRSSAENVRFTAKQAEMDYCRVVGPRGLCRPLDERQGSQQTLRLSHPVRVARKQSKAARLFEKRLWPFAKTAGQAGRAPSNRPRRLRTPLQTPCRPKWPGKPGSSRPICQFSQVLVEIGTSGSLESASPFGRNARPRASVGASSAHDALGSLGWI